MMLKYRVTSRTAKTPEFTLRKEPSDIDKLVMAIGSLTASMNESRESKQKLKMNEKIAKAIENFCLNYVRSLRCKLVRLANASKLFQMVLKPWGTTSRK
jgi:hypothetical protein